LFGNKSFAHLRRKEKKKKKMKNMYFEERSSIRKFAEGSLYVSIMLCQLVMLITFSYSYPKIGYDSILVEMPQNGNCTIPTEYDYAVPKGTEFWPAIACQIIAALVGYSLMIGAFSHRCRGVTYSEKEHFATARTVEYLALLLQMVICVICAIIALFGSESLV
jgi:hypothetical protein